MLAQGNQPADTVFGKIPVPTPLAKFGEFGIGNFLNLIFKLMIVGASIYALFNLILAGYAFMSAGDDPKKVEGAWAKIWQTMLGLLFTAGSFLLAALFGKIIFGEWYAILNPSIPTL